MEIIKIVVTRCQILRPKCSKFDFGWGSGALSQTVPNPAGELTVLPQRLPKNPIPPMLSTLRASIPLFSRIFLSQSWHVCWIISWPWSFKVIHTVRNIRKLGSGFLFAFHSNTWLCVSCITSRIMQDTGRKSWFFHIPISFDAPKRGIRQNIDIPFGVEKLEWWDYLTA